MKTNKFESTIRRKLESIEPDFQEQDWARMQNYMQTHTPPSFFQQYGSWIGYAAAASVTSVMAYLYVNQLSQNNNLVQDVKNLQTQIEVIRNQPAQVAKTDTVYIMHTTPDGQGLGVTQLAARQPLRQETARAHPRVERSQNAVASNALPNVGAPETSGQAFAQSTDERAQLNSAPVAAHAAETHATQPQSPALAAPSDGGRLVDFELAAIDSPVEIRSGLALQRKMHYELAGKLSGRQVQRALLANHMPVAKPAAPVKKAEQVAQAESVIPKLPLKTPYRFGGGFQVEGNGTGKSVLGEVIIKKKFSLAAGITWLKVKPAEFFNETIFREKNRRDFKAAHPGEVPLIFNLYNIKIDENIVQMPLTLAFRNTIKDDWGYYASMGTNVLLSAKETISFDCKGPKNEFFNQTITKKGDVSPITSMNFALGIEKSWHPIVVQAEGYWVNYFRANTPMRHNAGPGLKVKLLYQIGRQM